MNPIYLPIGLGLLVLLLFGAVFTVKQQSAAIIETFGRFSNIRQ